MDTTFTQNFQQTKNVCKGFFFCWQKIAFRYNIAEKSSPLAYFNLKFAILKCLKVVLGHILLLNACYINWGFFLFIEIHCFSTTLNKVLTIFEFFKKFFFNIKQITTK